MDTTTPTGKMVFTVLGAVAELERSLIVERVKAGLRNARAKGKRLGRPKRDVDASAIGALRAQGLPWRSIAVQHGFINRKDLAKFLPVISQAERRDIGRQVELSLS